MLGRYLADRQKHELIACGYGAASANRLPREDIEVMRKTLAAVIVPVSDSSQPKESAN
jgi:hypothetical protein